MSDPGTYAEAVEMAAAYKEALQAALSGGQAMSARGRTLQRYPIRDLEAGLDKWTREMRRRAAGTGAVYAVPAE